jgi:DNA (cytosine-5)-methyltransferase 1
MKAIDLFAGLGGFTEGARQAGVEVVWAANHWEAAVTCHSANHPGTKHVCQDLHQANWLEVPKHDLLLASPACQGHTPARGKERPHHDATRATAWAVVSCLECHRTPLAIVENVPKFLEWKLYPAWAFALECLGYTISPHVLDAADFGVPQHRIRLFLILSRSRAPLKLNIPKRPHAPIRQCIGWNDFPWNPVATHCQATLDRVASGRRDFGEQFAMPYYGSGSGETGRSLDRPLGTVTTRDRWALVDGNRMRMFQPPEYRAAMGFPDTYILPKRRNLAIHLLGNAVPPPMPATIIPLLN